MDAAVPGLATNPALFTAVNKDTAELHHELVPFDADLYDALKFNYNQFNTVIARTGEIVKLCNVVDRIYKDETNG